MKRNARQKIVVALDTDDPRRALSLVAQLRSEVGAFKFGKEFMSGTLRRIISLPKQEAFECVGALRALFNELDGNVFWDGKFNDIPNTVSKATGEIAALGVKMLNVHCTGGEEMMREAALVAKRMSNANGKKRPLVLGVTLLTSLSYQDLVKMGLAPDVRTPGNQNVEKEKQKIGRERIVQTLALLAKDCGLDGVVASAKEAPIIRRACGEEFKIVTPAIRPEWALPNDQNKDRITTPTQAIRAGADMLVIGRPITNPPPGIGSPIEAARSIQAEIEFALGERRGQEEKITLAD
ncbi:MAG TPA: orotidine-5'-phosphate decarboxylase [Candidatus Paceibacterota bacterium]